jgi:hypothetical protein
MKIYQQPKFWQQTKYRLKYNRQPIFWQGKYGQQTKQALNLVIFWSANPEHGKVTMLSMFTRAQLS